MKKENISSEGSLQNLIANIRQLSTDGQTQFGQCFENFLDLQLQFFCNNVSDRQKELYTHMREHEDFLKHFTYAMNILGDLSENFHDAIGDVFMRMVSHGENGQFFTPESVSDLMVQILVPAKTGDSINDPACGSGRTLLSALRYMREIANAEPVLYGNDISLTCSKMTLLNLLLNSADGMVTCGNTLTDNADDYIYFKIDRLFNVCTNTIFSTYWRYTTADMEDVSKRREQWFLDIAKKGWIRHSASSRAKADGMSKLPNVTTIKDGIQLNLFQ